MQNKEQAFELNNLFIGGIIINDMKTLTWNMIRNRQGKQAKEGEKDKENEEKGMR